MDLQNSVIIPREDFIELQTAAWDQPASTPAERIATTVQTTMVFAGMSAAVVAGCWGWAKAQNWLEQKRFNRHKAEHELHKDPK